MPVEPFADSIGAHTGKPERVEIEFDATAAPFVRDREWHKSQAIENRPDGSILVTLNVCVDAPLKQWVLGFGPAARVIGLVALAADILEAAQLTRDRYVALRPMLSAARVPRSRRA